MQNVVPTFEEYLNEDRFKRFIKTKITPKLKQKLKKFKKRIKNLDKELDPFVMSDFIDDMLKGDKQLSGIIQSEFNVENPTQWIMQQMEIDDEDDFEKIKF